MPDLEKAYDMVTMEAAALTWMAVHRNLCLALRHPLNDGASREITIDFVNAVSKLLVDNGVMTQAEIDAAARVERQYNNSVQEAQLMPGKNRHRPPTAELLLNRVYRENLEEAKEIEAVNAQLWRLTVRAKASTKVIEICRRLIKENATLLALVKADPSRLAILRQQPIPITHCPICKEPIAAHRRLFERWSRKQDMTRTDPGLAFAAYKEGIRIERQRQQSETSVPKMRRRRSDSNKKRNEFCRLPQIVTRPGNALDRDVAHSLMPEKNTWIARINSTGQSPAPRRRRFRNTGTVHWRLAIRR